MRTTAAVLLALTLSACSDGPADGPERERIEIQRPGERARTGPEGDALTAAGLAAEAATGATLVGLGQEEDGTWEADLLTDDGVELRVTTSADGTRVTERRRDDTDADDRAENRPLLQAGLTWGDALDAAAGALPGPVAELGLDEDDDRLVWEVGTGEESPGSTYLVDARSGELLGPEQD